MLRLSRNLLFFALLFSLNSFAQKNLKEIVEDLDNATFNLIAYNEKGDEIGKGSGFFIAADGLALGTAHVFANAASLKAIRNKEDSMNVQKLHSFETLGDLAIFKVDPGNNQISFFAPNFSSANVDEEVVVLKDISGKTEVDLGNVMRVEEIGGFGVIAEIEQKITEDNTGSAVLNREGELIGYVLNTGNTNIVLNWSKLERTNAILQDYSSSNDPTGAKVMPQHVRDRFSYYQTYMVIYEKILKGFYNSALEELNKSLGYEADDVGGVRNKQDKLFLKAYLEKKAEQPDKALETYTHILEQDLGNHIAYIQRSLIKIENGDLKSAAMDLDESSQYGGESAKIAKAKADIFTILDDLESAQKFYAMAEAKGYSGYELHKEKARMYLKMNEYVEAQMEIDKAMKGNPYDADLYMLNGKLQAKLGNTEAALAALKKSGEFNNSSEYSVLIEQAEAYILAEDYETAINIVKEVLAVDSNNLRAMYVEGVAFNKIQNYNQSRNNFNVVLKADPYHSMAYYERGKARIALAEYPDAIQDFTRCIKLKPNFVGAYIDRGVTYGLVGEFSDALWNFETALQIDPESVEALYNKGLALYQMQRFEEACMAFKNAAEMGHEGAASQVGSICEMRSDRNQRHQMLQQQKEMGHEGIGN